MALDLIWLYNSLDKIAQILCCNESDENYISLKILFQEYLSGGKLRVQEIGPYVFEEKWKRDDVEWSKDEEEVRRRHLEILPIFGIYIIRFVLLFIAPRVRNGRFVQLTRDYNDRFYWYISILQMHLHIVIQSICCV